MFGPFSPPSSFLFLAGSNVCTDCTQRAGANHILHLPGPEAHSVLGLADFNRSDVCLYHLTEA